ncbi:helix-turn-helix domain-containing protein [Nonomuraea sp. CA-141351]|uniref:helix-turn-helix domain-containing protein n=1 Tax=Nonomuraea sp. CA-141351 TaxID=3239996 RepID=UPI003D927D83
MTPKRKVRTQAPGRKGSSLVPTTSTRGEAAFEEQGAFFKAKRTERLDAMSLVQAAEAISALSPRQQISNSGISHWESGRRRADDRFVVMMALAYGNIDPDELDELGRGKAAEWLRKELAERAADQASTGDAHVDISAFTARLQRQIAEINTLPGAKPTDKKRMIEALLKHHESLADLTDAQLGLDTA